MTNEEAKKQIYEVLERKLCNGILKDQYQWYKDFNVEKEKCLCGGFFEFVEANLPYSDCYLQCNLYDGTKSLFKDGRTK